MGQFKKVLFASMSFGFLVISFQNCNRMAVRNLESTHSKVDGQVVQDLPSCPDCQSRPPQGRTEDGEVLIPVDDVPSSMYVCPEGTASSAKPAAAPAAAPSNSNSGSSTNSSYQIAIAVSRGPNASSSTSVSTSSGFGSEGTKSTASINQTGSNNSAYIYQEGPNNEASITQNGSRNTACIVQVGETNKAGIDQTGEDNSAGIEQTGGQGSQITQNGQAGQNAGVSAEHCGCRIVHCESSNSDLDPVCRQGLAQKVIVK